MNRPGRRVPRGMLPLLALHVVNEYYRLERKPPVTAGLLLTNTLIYLRPGPLDSILPTIDQVWFNPHLTVKNRDIKRFVLSAFYHMGESHLVYNMMSLLWKGVQLELAMGSTDFAVMIASLLGMSQGITLLLAKLLDVFFDYETSYYNEYAVGFSGVLFAMKVVLNARSEDFAYVHGLVVPARHAAWVELVLIQLFVPGVSFLGHLGGILAGILYLRLRGSGTRRDPMSIMLRRVIDILGWPVKHVRDYFRRRQGQTFGRGRVGGGEQGSGSRTGQVWRCSVCTFDNSSVLNRCAMCDMLRDGGQVSTGQGPVRRNREPSLEELRQRRLERFGR